MKPYILSVLKKRISVVFLSVMAIFLCFGILEAVRSPEQDRFEGEYTFTPGVAETRVVFSGISLKPGVYEVQLEYASEHSLRSHCNASDATVVPGAMRTNGEHMFAGLGATGYLMWLYESTDNLEIQVAYDGVGHLTIGNLTVQGTRLFGTQIISIVLFILSIYFGIVLYRAYDSVYGIGIERKKAIYGVAVIAFVASLWNFNGVLYSAGDLGYHLQRIEGIADGIRSGQFPVRLEPEWLYGHGYANGIFYCGTLLVFPALLRILGFTVTTAYNVFCIATNIATAWIAYYCFAKIFKDRTIGLICSALHTLSIIRIDKMQITAAVGEYSAMMFLPMIVYGFYLVLAEETITKEFKKAWIFWGVGYAGLIQTHVLSCEITAFLTIILCLIMAKRVFQKERFWTLAKGALTAAAMSAWFLIPFLDYFLNENMHVKHVSGRTIQDRGLFPAQLAINWWKRGSNPILGATGMQNSDPMGVGLLILLSFGLFAMLWFIGVWKQKKSNLIVLGKISTIFGGMLMLMSLNSFPWDSIQNTHPIAASLVSSLQFPNRFLSWATVFGIVSVGCCMWFVKEQQLKPLLCVIQVCIIVGIVTSGVYLMNDATKVKMEKVYNVEGMGRGYISGEEYVIQGTNSGALLYRAPLVREQVEITEYEKGPLQAAVTCKNIGTVPGMVDLPLLLYRGYRARDTETGEQLSIDYGENYTVCVTVPEGYEGTFEVKFVVPWYWRVGEMVSLLTFVGLAYMVIRNKCIYKRKKTA